MSTLAINNLAESADLNAITGGWSEVLSIFQGSHTIDGAWSFAGTSYTYKGQKYVSGTGWTYLYDKKQVYRRTQELHYHWDSFWK